MTPNRYGELALQHMERCLPDRYRQIENPDRYFTGLGEEIADQVRELETALAGPGPQDEDWMAKVGRLNMARLMAEERVLAELVYLAPEPEPDEPATDESGAYMGGRPGWEDPTAWQREPPDQDWTRVG
jgi:hypothetical protein